MEELPVYGWENISGTGDRECRCGSWKQHWKNFSGKPWPKKCSCMGCNEEATVGAHVRNSSVGKEEYIIPLCESCNHLPEDFPVKPKTVFVSANTKETCGH